MKFNALPWGARFVLASDDPNTGTVYVKEPRIAHYNVYAANVPPRSPLAPFLLYTARQCEHWDVEPTDRPVARDPVVPDGW